MHRELKIHGGLVAQYQAEQNAVAKCSLYLSTEKPERGLE